METVARFAAYAERLDPATLALAALACLAVALAARYVARSADRRLAASDDRRRRAYLQVATPPAYAATEWSRERSYRFFGTNVPSRKQDL